MRKIVVILVVVLLGLGLFAWPFLGIYDLARAAQSGDIERIEQRVDFARLGRSLSGQITQTYARLAGIPAGPGSLIAGVASAVADPIVARILTRVALAELVQNGWPKSSLGDPPAELPKPNWNALGDVWPLYANSEYGLGEFRIRLPVTAPRDKQFRLQLGLSGLTWKLSGIDLPAELQERIARELIKQQGKRG